MAQVDGMNCIGPTARSWTVSPSKRPPSVSRIRAVPAPVSGMPMTGGVESPSVCRVAPANRPWLDSTRPMAAIRVQLMPQPAWSAAREYASSAVAGMPLVARDDATAAGTSATGSADDDVPPDVPVAPVPAAAAAAVSAADVDPGAAPGTATLRAVAEAESDAADGATGPLSGTVLNAAVSTTTAATEPAVAPVPTVRPHRVAHADGMLPRSTRGTPRSARCLGARCARCFGIRVPLSGSPAGGPDMGAA